MDKDEELRQEILMLSKLIAINHPSRPALVAQSSPIRSNIFPSTRYGQPYSHRHHLYQRSPFVVNHAVNFRPAGGSMSEIQRVPSASKYRYTNPTQTHAIPYQKTSAAINVGLVPNQHGIASVSSELSLPSKAPTPKSVHINRAHLVSSTATGQNLVPHQATSTTSSSFKIRPHINPEHVAYHQLCSVPATATTSSAAVSQLGSPYSYLDANNASNEIGTFPHQLDQGNSFVNHRKQLKYQTAIKSKYKVDRRLRLSPDKLTTTKRTLNSSRIKIVKKYSTRLVHQSTTSPGSSKKTVYLPSYRKSTIVPPKQFHKSWMKSFNTSFRQNPKRNIYRKGSSRPRPRHKLSRFHSLKKTVVSIGGNNYLRKNSGRTLRKLKLSPPVVNIGGSQFICKNSGKPLNCFFRQSTFSRQKRILMSMSQTPGKLLAQRAVLKSKLTLSQRSWSKKRFCIYYNRLGECKKNEEGNCPYIHERKQLSICPKFVVGKCTIADCKLSHDLKVGRMPPCQFFNKSNCLRENCPYPHIKSASSKKNSPKSENVEVKEDEKELKNPTGTPRKRKLSVKREGKSPKNSKTNDNGKQSSDGQRKQKSRYYEQSPDSQPLLSIIPRRVRQVTPLPATGTDVTQTLNDRSRQINPVEANQADSSNVEACGSSSSANTDAKALQRARLMKKVSRLQEKLKPKESNAPQFLAFK